MRNFGHGLVGYTWEEGGPSLAAREGKETLEQHVENSRDYRLLTFSVHIAEGDGRTTNEDMGRGRKQGWDPPARRLGLCATT